MATIFIMSAKIASLSLFRIKIFQNKVYDVIISVHNVTGKIFSLGSSYIVDVVMWPKFGNYSISMRKVIITLVL